MRVGLSLRNAGPQGVDAVRRITDLAADLSYDAVWASDHIAVPPSFAEQHFGEWIDPFVALSIAAERAPELILGFSVLVIPYRHELLAANALASLQSLSRGRVVCGAGSGFLRDEFAALGGGFEQRGDITDARLRVIRERVPDVPMLAGGNSQRVLLRAAWLGGWHPIGRTPSFVAERKQPGMRVALRSRLGLGVERGERPLFGSEHEVAADLRAYADAGVDDLVVDYAARDLDEVERQVRALAVLLGEAIT